MSFELPLLFIAGLFGGMLNSIAGGGTLSLSLRYYLLVCHLSVLMQPIPSLPVQAI